MRRTTAAGLLLTLAASLAAAAPNDNAALREARGMVTNGRQIGMGYDGGCIGGACTGDVNARIDAAAESALKPGGLTLANTQTQEAITAQVPAPTLTADAKGAKEKKPSFFRSLFTLKGAIYGLAGAALGAGLGWVLGPAGALLGGIIGGIAGLLLAKYL